MGNSVPPGLSGLNLNSDYSQTSQMLNAQQPLTNSTSFTKGHKRTGSYGGQVNATVNDEFQDTSPQSSLNRAKSYSEHDIFDSGDTVVNHSLAARRISQDIQYDPREHLFDAHLTIPQELRPIQPDTSIKESMEIFNEHRLLALEFLRKQLEYNMLLTRRDELQNTANNNVDDENEYKKLIEEKISLIHSKENLIGQLDAQRRRERQRDAIQDGDWVYVDKTNL